MPMQPAPVLRGGCGIAIDGYDLAHVPLTRLRRSISVIPQDPTLYSGSVRFNVDPFGERSDDEIITALTRVQLWERKLLREGGLDYMLSDGGQNLSVGARQLVCREWRM